MLLLADTTGFAARLAGASAPVRRPTGSDLERLPPPAASVLLPPGRHPVAAADLPPSGWPLVLAIEDAPRSQFDALAGMPGGPAELPGRLLAVAGRGRGFHGQRRRPWIALPGNLHLVASVPLDLPAARCPGPLAALPAVAVVRAIDSLPGFADRAAIKWVNDVLLDDRKVAGVLTRTWTRGDRVTGLLLGIGVDVEARPFLADEPRGPGAVSLAGAAPPGAPVPTLAGAFLAVARELAACLELLAAGRGSELVARYRARAGFLGRRVAVEPDPLLPGEPADEVVRGRVLAVGDQLELRVEGHERPVTRGRLRFLD